MSSGCPGSTPPRRLCLVMVKERYIYGWTDYRGMYSGGIDTRLGRSKSVYDIRPETFSVVMGTVFIMIPVAWCAFWVWRLMGWL